MSSDSEESDAGAGYESKVADPRAVRLRLPRVDSDAESFSRTRPPDDDELVENEEEDDNDILDLNGTGRDGYTTPDRPTEQSSSATLSPTKDDLTSRDGSASLPDDTPSVRNSVPSSPTSSRAHSQLSVSKLRRPGVLQPFDRRFSARLSSSRLDSSQQLSPAFLAVRSRQPSIASTIAFSQDGSESSQAPWEVVRWTKLKKITAQVFSEIGRRNFGRATVVAVTACIAVGTSKGLALVFDNQQNLIATIGLGTRAVECGPVTSISFSADHSTLACGHADGHIFTWEVARPAKPFLHIEPLARAQLEGRSVDGHIAETAIVHVGFLGIRHTALVSADEGGMAFSHLATRGLGSVARRVKTIRILGRYPVLNDSSQRPRKASSVLAFSPLPLGNAEQPTDSVGLTALLTPYLLVIVSTTPIAETQFKTARPKELAPHSTLSGCLAWFPAVKLKKSAVDTEQTVSKSKLAYCWSTILTVLDVDVDPSQEPDKPPTIHFRPRSRWKSEEAIVAVQWLHRSVLCVLTISQRLIILEDPSLRVTDTFDLVHKHIYHQDLFSKQLRHSVEQLDEQDSSMHGVVADAFHMSFRAYKGRLYVLGFNDMSVGILSNWADRLVALMEDGDYIAAIHLATAYYSGDADKVSVGLPEDDESRHDVVRGKLLELISASLKYMFNRQSDDPTLVEVGAQRELATAAFIAITKMAELDFLFDKVYEAYEDAAALDVFFEVLEPYIMSEEVIIIPPNVLQELIKHYAKHRRTARLEALICRLDTETMDLHLVTTLCKSNRLYDALTYVWNQAIGDYVTPLIEFLHLIRLIREDASGEGEQRALRHSSATKIFPYLACVLTGKVYPSGIDMEDADAHHAKAEVYRFLFSGRPVDWPPGSKKFLRTCDEDATEPAYPYLSLILHFDSGSLISVLNEAYEDQFLNGTPNDSNGVVGSDNTHRATSLLPTRQTIISMLQEVLSSGDFERDESIYFDMFIAQNLPKFPQFIVLPGKALNQTLENLCDYPSGELAEDCQLSVEYLLSFYHPPNLEALIPLFRRAEFFRVLKTVYRGNKEWAHLLETYFEDPRDQEGVYQTVLDGFRFATGTTTKEVEQIEGIIIRNAHQFCSIDTIRAGRTLQECAPRLIDRVLDAMEEGSQLQYSLLNTLLEPPLQEDADPISTNIEQDSSHLEERYVRLMCHYAPSHIVDYISTMKSGDLRLTQVLPSMEKNGVIDAAVVLMTREGMVREAMARLVKHMQFLETALTGLVRAAADSPDIANTKEAADGLVDDVQKYVKVGIWLCQGQSNNGAGPVQSASSTALSQNGARKNRATTGQLSSDPEAALNLKEMLWLDLIDSVVSITRNTSAISGSMPSTSTNLDTSQIATALRSSVQTAFTALLTSTTQPAASDSLTPLLQSSSTTQPHPSFLLILRAFLSRASRASPSLSDLRQVLSEIFAAYAFEETILHLATQFLDKTLFAHVDEAWRLRQRGWRPRSNVCEMCKRRLWGPGAGRKIWEAWESNRRIEENAKRTKGLQRTGDATGGKARASASMALSVETTAAVESVTPSYDDRGPLVVFACRHVWHRKCLEESMHAKQHENGGLNAEERAEVLKCPLVHI